MSIQAKDRKAAESLLKESGLTLAQCVRLVLDALDALPRGLEQEERTRALRESMRLGRRRGHSAAAVSRMVGRWSAY